METLGRRRTERILAPIRIRVVGSDASGASFSEDTVTVSFNQQGARISLTHTLLPDNLVLVRNLENECEERFRVVGDSQEVSGSRREWGVEAVNPESSIWGLGFACGEDSTHPRALIECTECSVAAQSIVSRIDYEVLLATSLISRHCAHCSKTTRWKPASQVVVPEIKVRSSRADAEGRQNTRRTPRLRLTMQFPVRDSSGVVEIAQTRDVSKTGLCFVSTRRFTVTDRVYIVLPYALDHPPAEITGNVIWAAEGTIGRFYGVEYRY